MADMTETLRKLGLAAARGVPQLATGFVDLAALPFTMTGMMKPEQAVGSTAYLTSKGLLPPPQEGLLSETTELVSSAVNPATAAKAALAKGGLLMAAPIAYHGTTKEIAQLNPKKSFGDLNVSWVSPSPEFASKYATREGGNVMPLEVNEGKVFDFADQKSLDKLTKKASSVQIYDPIRGSITLDKLVPKAGESYKTAENPQLFNLIKKMGYDSVAVYEDGVRNLGIFNPKKNIKSKFEK